VPFLCAFAPLRETDGLWHARCSRDNRHDTEYTKTLTVPPPPTSPERRLPLRQLTFRATLQCFPPKRGPGEIGRVFPLLNTLSPSSEFNLPSDTLLVGDEICHFDSDGFCLFEPFLGELTQLNQFISTRAKKIFPALLLH